MNKFCVFVLLAFVTIISTLSAKSTYYVATSGDDNNLGTSPDAPWATINKVNSVTYNAGDSILFKCGDEWRIPNDERLDISSSGTNVDGYRSYITVSSYGTGNKPRLLGSKQLSNWTNVSGDIWQASIEYNSIETDYGAELFFVFQNDSVAWGVSRDYDEDFSNLTEKYDWTWNDGIAYVNMSGNPDDFFKSVEAPKSLLVLYLNDKEYVTIDGLEIAYAVLKGVADSYEEATYLAGAKISNMHIHHIGRKDSGKAYGLALKHSEMVIEYNEIHDCGRRNISINLYKDEDESILMENVHIRNNYLHDGWHTTGIDGINSGVHVMQNIYIYNNLIDDDKYLERGKYNRYNNTTSNHIYITADSWATSRNIYIFNNILKNCTAKTITIDGVDNMYVCNNTFYGVAQNVVYANSQNLIHCTDITSGIGEFEIVNNIIYNDANTTNAKYANCLYFDYDRVDSARNVNYNLYYSSDAEGSNGRLTNVFEWTVVDDIYKESNFSDWISKYGFDTNSPAPADPMFTDPANNDFSLQAESPAVGAGIPIDWITTDYYGNTRDTENPSIGAIEYTLDVTTNLENTIDSESDFVISPNPTDGIITLDFIHSNELVQLSIYSTTGKLVYDNPAFNEGTLDLSKLRSGIYILKANSGTTSSSQKLIKE